MSTQVKRLAETDAFEQSFNDDTAVTVSLHLMSTNDGTSSDRDFPGFSIGGLG